MAITLEAAIVQEDAWPTKVLMPWVQVRSGLGRFRLIKTYTQIQTDAINVGWQVWSFDRTLMDLEPEQGVPRYVTQEFTHHNARLVRRGLAFMLE